MIVTGHGKRTRYRKGCRCMSCCRSNASRAEEFTGDLRWPLRYLTKRHSEMIVADALDSICGMTIQEARAEGLSDFDADAVAVVLGDLPMFVWPGWLEAGLDYHE